MNEIPNLVTFDPTYIPYQAQVIDDIKHNFDYSFGVHEVLLSGSVGSAKSTLLAHLIVRHCVENPRGRVLVGRHALPDLRETIWAAILEHMDGALEEGIDYNVNKAFMTIKFSNGAEILAKTWHDARYKKFRSLALSMVVIEELTENGEQEKQAYDELKLRLNRIPGVKENIFISATNPDSPSHWVYEYFEMDKPNRTRTKHVYLSSTADNPFLPESYKEQLKNDLDEKMYRRMVKGEWLEIKGDVIYYAYDNYRDIDYDLVPLAPIHISWDFNIGEGKPLSVSLFQFIGGKVEVFDEVIIHGADTYESLEEIAARGYFNLEATIMVHGDATGASKSTKSKRSDYDIIKKYLSNYRHDGMALDFEMCVPKSNPPVRDRHNLVNAYCRNANGVARLNVYRKCKMTHKGMRLTALKKGGSYIEDDSKEYQHVTTALGYGIFWIHKKLNQPISRSRRVQVR